MEEAVCPQRAEVMQRIELAPPDGLAISPCATCTTLIFFFEGYHIDFGVAWESYFYLSVPLKTMVTEQMVRVGIRVGYKLLGRLVHNCQAAASRMYTYLGRRWSK